MADQVGGNRLHCSTCKDDRIFRPNSNHKHWGRTVARENFTECIGERCDRCRRWRELKARYPSNQTELCAGCGRWDYPRNRLRHERCRTGLSNTTLNPAESQPAAEQMGLADELDEDGFQCAEEDLGEVNQVALGWQDDNRDCIRDLNQQVEDQAARHVKQQQEKIIKQENTVSLVQQQETMVALRKTIAQREHAHQLTIDRIERETEEKVRQERARTEQNKVAAQLMDSASIGDQLREMQVPFDLQKLGQFLSKQKEVAALLQQINLTVNNNQFAAAIAAVYDDSHRQFLSVPSGMGKSRIIAAVIALQNICRSITCFTVVFTTELLKRASQAYYEKIAAVLGLTLNLRVYDPRLSLDGLVLPGHYAVVDEADVVLLDHAQTLTNPRMLALSATPFSDHVAEREHVVDVLGFKVIDSKMEGSISFESASTATKTATVEKFFAASKCYAKLIYNTGESHLEIARKATLTNPTDLDRLKQLTPNDVILITDPALARGVDYRADERTRGIALFVMSACNSQRAYVQLLGRVGRYKEPCERFVWDQLSNVVDMLEQAKMLGKLHRVKTIRRHAKRQHKQIQNQGLLGIKVTVVEPAKAKPTVTDN